MNIPTEAQRLYGYYEGDTYHPGTHEDDAFEQGRAATLMQYGCVGWAADNERQAEEWRLFMDEPNSERKTYRDV